MSHTPPVYTLEDLFAHNRQIAERFPEVWSKFRWRMRGSRYGREEINDAFYFYRMGWYDGGRLKL